jgi:DNA primase
VSGLPTIEKVARYYEAFLLHESLGGPGRQFLRDRGVPLEQARAWRLGLSPNAPAFMTRILEGRGVTREELVLAGVAKAEGRAGYFELLRGRLVFPHTENGRVVGFTGRILPGRETSAKYLSTCQTPLFSRSRALFGLDQARGALAGGVPAVLVEGSFDALALHRAGITSSVALSGLSFGAAVLESLIAAGARSLVAMFDGDQAGVLAAARVASSSLVHPTLPTSIALCPEGLDPDEVLARESAAGVRARIDAARPAADFLIDRLPERSSGQSPEHVLLALGDFVKQFPAGFAFSPAQLAVISNRLSLQQSLVEGYLVEQVTSQQRTAGPR